MVTEVKTKPYIMTEISTEKYSRQSTAPNGSSRGEDFYTVVISLQDWISGQYAGYTYKIIETWISQNPQSRGQYIGRSSSYHSGPAE